jgi:RNA polymerase sigma-70 factor (ECF subfamily)
VREAYEAYGAGIYRFAVGTLRDPGLAEEVVQDTFVRAWRARHRYDPAAGSPRTWLFAIARNVAADLARARAARPRSFELRDGTGFVEDPSEDVHRSWQVEEALERLSDEHRRVVVEIAVNQRTCRDVAAELGVPEGTVRSRLYYALRALRSVLAELGYSPPYRPVSARR